MRTLTYWRWVQLNQMGRRRPFLRCTTVTEVSPVASMALARFCLGSSMQVERRLIRTSTGAGSTVARFAGDTVHERLAQNDAFKRKDYEAALKRAFLETDEDLRASELILFTSVLLHCGASRR